MDLSHLARHPGLKGRSVLVTGGGSGIGAAIVESFLDQGAKVAFIDIDEAKSQQLAADLKAQYGTPPLFIRCDLKDIPALHGPEFPAESPSRTPSSPAPASVRMINSKHIIIKYKMKPAD